MYPDHSWVQAYLKGNLLMPQAYEAGSIFLAQAALAHGRQSALERLENTTRLSPAQTAWIRDTMHAVHAVRRIPAGSHTHLERARADGFDMRRTILIDDEKLTYIWNRFRTGGILIAQYFSDDPDCVRRLAGGFYIKECLSLLQLYRAQYDRRNHQGSDARAGELRVEILTHVERFAFHGYRDIQQGFLSRLFAEHAEAYTKIPNTA